MADREKRSPKKAILIAVCIFEAILLALLIFVVVFVSGKLGMINRKGEFQGMSEEEYMKGETNNPDITGDVVDPDEIVWGDDAPQIGGGKNVINILLIGQDRREGEGRCRSDAMILCTINKSAKTLTMSSFMRDMYVQIPGYLDNRINASYSFGGMDLLDACLNLNFGIVVDGNVEVDFSGFQEVIDLVGGVDIELTAAEAEYLNRRGNWDIEDNSWEWSLVEGVNHLNGSQALAYSRIREVGNADFGRTNRQRIVLSTLIESAKDMNVGEVNKLLDKILPLLTTDLTDPEIIRFVMELLPILPDLKISTQQIPAEGSYYGAFIREMAVLVPDLEMNREILADIMGE